MITPDNREFKWHADNAPQSGTLLQIHKQWKLQCVSVGGVKLRAGLFPSKLEKPKANVLYLEGLADSIFNHENLFDTLSEAGYHGSSGHPSIKTSD